MCFQLEVYFDRFAESKEAFFEAYSKAHTKLSELGSKFEPAEGWGPGGMGGWSGKLLDGIFLVAKNGCERLTPFFFWEGVLLSGWVVKISTIVDLHLFFVVSPWIFDATPGQDFRCLPPPNCEGGFALLTWKRPNDTDTKRAEKKDMDPFLLYLRFWKNQRHFFLKKGCKVAWNLQSFFITVRNWISVELKPSAFRSWSENKWSDFSLPTFGHSISSIATRSSWELDKKKWNHLGEMLGKKKAKH